MTGSSAPTLQRAENGVWYIHWVEGRRSKRVTVRTRELSIAKIAFANWLLDEAARTVVPELIQNVARRRRGFTCARFWGLYRAQHVAKNSTSPESADWAWNNLKRHFGKLPIANVTQPVVDSYVKKRLAGRTGRPSQPATVRRELMALSAAFNWCAGPRQKLIPSGDVPKYELPPPGTPRDRWLRPDEMQRLFDSAAAIKRAARLSRGERFLWLASETAARKTAILELTWDRVDFQTGIIHYDVPGRKKTKKRRPSVPISQALLPILRRAYDERLNKKRSDGIVLDNSANVWPIVRRIAKRANVSDVSPHVFRHTAATYMARRGVPLWKIAGVLGNTVAVVERVYAKHAPDGLLEAVNAISLRPPQIQETTYRR